MRLRLWPRSIAGRTFLVLLTGLFVAQVIALTIHALDRVEVQRAQQAREAIGRTAALWRTLLMADPSRRDAIARSFDLPEGMTASVDPRPLARDQGSSPSRGRIGSRWASPGSAVRRIFARARSWLAAAPAGC